MRIRQLRQQLEVLFVVSGSVSQRRQDEGSISVLGGSLPF